MARYAYVWNPREAEQPAKPESDALQQAVDNFMQNNDDAIDVVEKALSNCTLTISR